MDSSFWFYTLSAIPQTLAAVIAVTATFIIFKLESIDRGMDSDVFHIKIFLPIIDKDFDPYIDRSGIKEILDPLKLAKDKLNRKDESLGLDPLIFEDLREACGQIIKYGLSGFPLNAENIYKFVDYKYSSLFNSNKIKSKIKIYLKECLLLTATPIVLSLLFLPTYGSLIKFNYLIEVIISILVGLSGASVAYIIYAILKISEFKN